MRVWQGCGIYLFVADVGIDSSTEHGREQLRQLAEVAQLQYAGKAVRARQREKERIAAGGLCVRPPLGMKYVGKLGQRRLVADVEEQALLKRMAGWRRKGLTLREIWLHLLKHGATRRSTGREWSLAAIARAVPLGERLLAGDAAAQ